MRTDTLADTGETAMPERKVTEWPMQYWVRTVRDMSDDTLLQYLSVSHYLSLTEREILEDEIERR